jgi:hypothetical protein
MKVIALIFLASFSSAFAQTDAPKNIYERAVRLSQIRVEIEEVHQKRMQLNNEEKTNESLTIEDFDSLLVGQLGKCRVEIADRMDGKAARVYRFSRDGKTIETLVVPRYMYMGSGFMSSTDSSDTLIKAFTIQEINIGSRNSLYLQFREDNGKLIFASVTDSNQNRLVCND